MQTSIDERYRQTALGIEADRVLRSCVHCGFCNATCPTYQLLGDELDGPRGRIYQIKQILEGTPAAASIRTHLDRCLTCRNCETTCPSGVDYHRLLDIGRTLVEQQLERPWHERVLRYALLRVLPYRRRFAPLLRLGRLVRPLLPAAVKAHVPLARATGARPAALRARRVILLEGCVQPALAPQINAATVRVLDRLGVGVVTGAEAGCCGALPWHLTDNARALAMARTNVDAWWPLMQAGAEAIVINASGCAPMVKDYGHLLRDDPVYADKAAQVSALARDAGEFVATLDPAPLKNAGGQRIAFHAPCTLQHGQRLAGVVERLLGGLGFELTPVADPHLCCGAAGTYSLLQPAISRRLRDAKCSALQQGSPTLIATANIGCMLHLDEGTAVPVVHWLELLDRLRE